MNYKPVRDFYKCSACKAEFPKTEFLNAKGDNIKIYAKCKKCRNLSIQKRRYRPSKKESSELRLLLLECFRSRCCVCGYNIYWQALEFHHVDPGLKTTTARVLLHRLMQAQDLDTKKGILASIRKELGQCVLLCSNCHQAFHAGALVVSDFSNFITEIDWSSIDNFVTVESSNIS